MPRLSDCHSCSGLSTIQKKASTDRIKYFTYEPQTHKKRKKAIKLLTLDNKIKTLDIRNAQLAEKQTIHLFVWTIQIQTNTVQQTELEHPHGYKQQ